MQSSTRSQFGRVAKLGIFVLCSAVLASCATPQPKATTKKRSKEYFAESVYGVKASPRVAYGKSNLPRGGGRDQTGKPYQVKGRWYYPKEEKNYAKVGGASWYGDAFHGRLTANGEIYDMTHLTAAHPTMPLPSYARVTNVRNGASVIVRVNDRGPYERDRIIDLSHRAAEMLDYAHHGIANVKVEYVGRAPLEGNDDKFLMASYRPGRDGGPKRDPFSDGLPDGVMMAMNGASPSKSLRRQAPQPVMMASAAATPAKTSGFSFGGLFGSKPKAKVPVQQVRQPVAMPPVAAPAPVREVAVASAPLPAASVPTAIEPIQEVARIAEPVPMAPEPQIGNAAAPANTFQAQLQQMQGQPMQSVSYGEVQLPDFGPILPEKPQMRMALATMSYADERVESAAQAFAAMDGATMSSDDVASSWKRLNPVAKVPVQPESHDAYLAAGTFSSKAEAARVAAAFAGHGRVKTDETVDNGTRWYSVNVYPSGSETTDDLLELAWAHGAPDAFVVRD